jgi:hypothetical protein
MAIQNSEDLLRIRCEIYAISMSGVIEYRMSLTNGNWKNKYLSRYVSRRCTVAVRQMLKAQIGNFRVEETGR